MDLDQFDHLSPEELRETAKRLQTLAYQKEGGNREYTPQRLSKLLDLESDDFMGTGMSFQDFLLCGRMEDIAHSFVSQDKDERKRRLGFIIRLGAELDKLRNQGVLFSTGLAEASIEDVILGDWKMVNTWAGHFEFTEEHEQTREQYAPLFAPFVGLLREAFNTRPGAEPTPKATH